ncbi:MAG: hypothetical protein PHD81_04645 [Candidatus Nanoarchaeia archaeon]|nr:hypothetical protein [Candidatus Nanoarchaeia archaeon]MDD5588365.1 hypothetical protein [Candidatus Nanoarchaeia archaeon]
MAENLNSTKKHEVLMGLTTNPKYDWKLKIGEIINHEIRRIALFPTQLDIKEREQLYYALESIPIKPGTPKLQIPLVHLRHDTKAEEIKYLIENWKTKVFNVHEELLDSKELDDYRHIIYVENRFKTPEQSFKESLKNCAGLCLDVTHLHEGRINLFSKLRDMNGLLEECKEDNIIGCSHVSAIDTNKWNPRNYLFGFERHKLSDYTELKYIQNYLDYLPYFISLELDNKLEHQIHIKFYLENLIEGKDLLSEDPIDMKRLLEK